MRVMHTSDRFDTRVVTIKDHFNYPAAAEQHTSPKATAPADLNGRTIERTCSTRCVAFAAMRDQKRAVLVTESYFSNSTSSGRTTHVSVEDNCQGFCDITIL
jgi:hypothetical protein